MIKTYDEDKIVKPFKGNRKLAKATKQARKELQDRSFVNSEAKFKELFRNYRAPRPGTDWHEGPPTKEGNYC